MKRSPSRPATRLTRTYPINFTLVGYYQRLLGRTRTLDSHASRLRRKLAAVGAGRFVLNVWGVGYRLVDD
jgi:DNA-binding response OmpR family regulator